jgi:arylsulfatase A-like enzyme
MFTGLPPGEHGLHWIPSAQGGELRRPARERLLAQLLRQRGYTTFGVSNNQWVSAQSSLDEGFDRFYFISPSEETRDEAIGRWLGPEALADTRAEQSLALFRKHLDALELDRPLFAFFNLIEPHFPYAPPPSFAGHFGGDIATLRKLNEPSLELAMLGGSVRPSGARLTDLYDEELAYVDHVVGKLLAELRARGLYDDSLIIVTSDHGEHLGEKGRYSHQLSMADELLRVPLIVRYPGGVGAGSVVDHPLVSTLDLHQTVLAAAWPDNPLRAGRSQDLAHMDEFARTWSLSEYYYSSYYLSQIEKFAPRFDPRPHEQIRRVVVTEDGVFEMQGTSADQIEGLPAAVRPQVARYLLALGSQADSHGDSDSFDPEELEGLRALGYVE